MARCTRKVRRRQEEAEGRCRCEEDVENCPVALVQANEKVGERSKPRSLKRAKTLCARLSKFTVRSQRFSRRPDDY
jgi:hypothetical protein